MPAQLADLVNVLADDAAHRRLAFYSVLTEASAEMMRRRARDALRETFALRKTLETELRGAWIADGQQQRIRRLDDVLSTADAPDNVDLVAARRQIADQRSMLLKDVPSDNKTAAECDNADQLDYLEAVHAALHLVSAGVFEPMVEHALARGPAAFRVLVDNVGRLQAQLYGPLQKDHLLIFQLYARLKRRAPTAELDMLLLERMAGFCAVALLNESDNEDERKSAAKRKVAPEPGPTIDHAVLQQVATLSTVTSAAHVSEKDYVWRRARDTLLRHQDKFDKSAMTLETVRKYSQGLTETLQGIFVDVSRRLGPLDMALDIIALGNPLGMQLATPLAPLSFALLGQYRTVQPEPAEAATPATNPGRPLATIVTPNQGAPAVVQPAQQPAAAPATAANVAAETAAGGETDKPGGSAGDPVRDYDYDSWRKMVVNAQLWLDVVWWHVKQLDLMGLVRIDRSIPLPHLLVDYISVEPLLNALRDNLTERDDIMDSELAKVGAFEFETVYEDSFNKQTMPVFYGYKEQATREHPDGNRHPPETPPFWWQLAHSDASDASDISAQPAAGPRSRYSPADVHKWPIRYRARMMLSWLTSDVLWSSNGGVAFSRFRAEARKLLKDQFSLPPTNTVARLTYINEKRKIVQQEYDAVSYRINDLVATTERLPTETPQQKNERLAAELKPYRTQLERINQELIRLKRLEQAVSKPRFGADAMLRWIRYEVEAYVSRVRVPDLAADNEAAAAAAAAVVVTAAVTGGQAARAIERVRELTRKFPPEGMPVPHHLLLYAFALVFLRAASLSPERWVGDINFQLRLAGLPTVSGGSMQQLQKLCALCTDYARTSPANKVALTTALVAELDKLHAVVSVVNMVGDLK